MSMCPCFGHICFSGTRKICLCRKLILLWWGVYGHWNLDEWLRVYKHKIDLPWVSSLEDWKDKKNTHDGPYYDWRIHIQNLMPFLVYLCANLTARCILSLTALQYFVLFHGSDQWKYFHGLGNDGSVYYGLVFTFTMIIKFLDDRVKKNHYS